MLKRLTWLRARCLICRHPVQSSESAIIITRLGQQVIADGPRVLHAVDRLQEGLHPAIESRARSQFLLGAYEEAVFASMKAIEVRVRQLGGFGNDLIGVDLINHAFGRNGSLTDPSVPSAEQEGTRALFAGAYAVFRNPTGHREVDFEDVTEAAEMVQSASLLMRILDRVEARLAAAP